MRLRHIHIDGFGSIRNLVLEGLPGGLVILLGDNEAGKTTCLTFVRDVLFGFRDGRSAENNYLPADGGRYGGRLTLVNEKLGEISIERRPGKKGGPVSVLFGDGRKGGEEVLSLILGATTRDLFRNVYAFSLSELQNIETLKSDAVKSVLYGAAMGASTVNLSSALDSIDAAMGDLFRPGGRNPRINRKLADLEQKRMLLREAQGDIDRYDQAALEAVEVDRRLEELRVAITEKRWEHERMTALVRLWPDWLALTDLERALRGLPEHVDIFPEDGLKLLEGLLQRIEGAEQLLADLRAERDTDKREADSLLVDEALLAQSTLVRELLSRKEVYMGDCAALLTNRQKLETAQQGIEGLLGDLGSGWTEEKVLSVDRSLFTREEILRQQKGLEEQASKRLSRLNIAETAKGEFDSAIRGEEEARKVLEACDSTEMEIDQGSLRLLQNGRDQFASVIRDLLQVKRQIDEERERLMAGIREISPAWGEPHVRGFDGSMAARQRVQRIEEQTVRVEGETGRVADELARTRRESDAEDQRLQEIEARIGRLGARPQKTKEDVQERKATLRLLRTILTQKEKIEGQIGYEESRLAETRRRRDEYADQAVAATPLNLMPFSVGCAAAAGAAFVSLLFPLRHDLPLVAGTALLLAAIALYWIHARFRRSIADRVAAWEEKKRSADSEILEEEAGIGRLKETLDGLIRKAGEKAASLSVAGDVTAEDIDGLEAEAEREARRIEEWETLEGQRDESRARAKALRTDREKLEEAGAELRAALEKVQVEWAGYLRDSDLPEGLTPRAGNLVFLKVENLKGEMTRLGDLEGRLDRMEQARRDYYALAGSVPSLSRAAGEDDPANLLSAVDLLLERTRELEVRQRRREVAAEALEDRLRRRKAAAEDLEKAMEAVEAARLEEARGLESWGHWLASHGLSGEISPSVALEAFARISDCVREIGEKERLRKEIDRLRTAAEAYLGLVQSLFTALGRAVPSREKIGAAIEGIAEEHDLAKTNATKKEGLARKMDALSSRIEEHEKALTKYRDEMSRLLVAAAVTGEDDFRRRGRLFEEKREILANILRTEGSLRKISGEEDLAHLREELKGLNLEELKVSETECEDALQGLESERESLRQKKAELGQIMARLASADDISRLRAEEEAIVEEIRALSKEWGRYAMAKALLAEARRRYEQEQQPKVINDAGQFFREMTGGAYGKVVAPLGGETIEVITKGGEVKRPEILSRGTAEQLYLAIRFAYINNYSAHTESLPVIMDDVLVNFDPRRTEYALGAILRLAESHQVLYFTCHPETVERCRRFHPGVSVLSLRGTGHPESIIGGER